MDISLVCTIFAGDMEELNDSYRTLAGPAEGSYSEKRSKFIALAVPVRTVEEVKARIEECTKRYYDARHVCYAYVLGPERKDFRANDNGEPSGTAGKPILGQINSRELTDVLVMVVRYFGGIKLGTSGLIVAYRTAAAEALDAAETVERTVDAEVTVDFEYPLMNEVMRIVKEEGPAIVSQGYDTDCRMVLRIRRGRMPRRSIPIPGCSASHSHPVFSLGDAIFSDDSGFSGADPVSLSLPTTISFFGE